MIELRALWSQIDCCLQKGAALGEAAELEQRKALVVVRQRAIRLDGYRSVTAYQGLLLPAEPDQGIAAAAVSVDTVGVEGERVSTTLRRLSGALEFDERLGAITIGRDTVGFEAQRRVVAYLGIEGRPKSTKAFAKLLWIFALPGAKASAIRKEFIASSRHLSKRNAENRDGDLKWSQATPGTGPNV